MKKAQGQIITTILIILLILAVIVIIWQVVNRTVRTGSEEISLHADCTGINLEIESVYADGSVTIRRKTGGPEKVAVYAVPTGGTRKDGLKVAGIKELEVDTVALVDSEVNVETEVKVGAKLIGGDETLCFPVSVKKAVAVPA
ncbi:hypothetical protein HOE04_03165 [archaeon]|jgi:hypothetical protein|nr:hypothetical protein [archaeon]